MDKNYISFTSGILLAIIVGFVVAGKQQSITLYESTASNATNEIFTSNVRNLLAENVTSLKTVLRACVQSKGIWMYYTSPDYLSTEGTQGTFYHPTNNENIISCTPDNLSNNITSIRHIGHSDLSISAISFYTEYQMQRSPKELYFEGYKLILPFSIEIKSYAFTGLKNWIISNNVPFAFETSIELQKLQNKCLDIMRSNDNTTMMDRNVLAYNERLSKPLGVIFIQRGCTGLETIVYPESSVGLGENESANMTDESNNAAVMMNGPGLILTVKLPPTFTLGNNATSDLTMIGDKLSLPNTIQIINFTFIGTSCFTIYEDIDFMGNKKCLVPGTKFIDEEYGNKPEHTVGSIKIGCDNEAIRCINNNSNNSALIISSMQIMFSTILTIFIMIILK